MSLFLLIVATLVSILTVFLLPVLLMWTGLGGWTVRKLSRRAEEPDPAHAHEAPSAVRQPVGRWPAIGAAALATVLLLGVAWGTIVVLSAFDARNFTSVTPTFLRELDPSRSPKVLHDALTAKWEGEEGPKTLAADMNRFVEAKGLDYVGKEDLRDGFVRFFKYDFADESATTAFAALLHGLSLEQNAEEDLDLISQARRAIIGSAVVLNPLDPTPRSFAQFNQRVVNGKIIQANVADGSSPESVALQRAIYRRIVDELAGYRRLQRLFVGPIQALTIFAFYLCMILLAGRRELVRIQGCREIDRFVIQRLKARDKDFDGVNARPRSDTSTISAIDPLDPGSISRERSILKATMTAWSALDKSSEGTAAADRHLTAHLAAPSLAHRVLDAVESSIDGSALTPAQRRTAAMQATERVLGSAIDDQVERLDQVGYAPIQYLVYAIPSLGFVGTVIGLSSALGSAHKVVTAGQQAGGAEGVEAQARAVADTTALLGYAFDTTLLALIASIIATGFVAKIRSAESEVYDEIKHTIGDRYGR